MTEVGPVQKLQGKETNRCRESGPSGEFVDSACRHMLSNRRNCPNPLGYIERDGCLISPLRGSF
jgi:hypothetical protein